jgi:hypothetical protein
MALPPCEDLPHAISSGGPQLVLKTVNRIPPSSRRLPPSPRTESIGAWSYGPPHARRQLSSGTLTRLPPMRRH